MGQYQADLLDTPSPSDSGISELEAALRDRDSELAYLRQTMEHNEKVIFRVHQVSGGNVVPQLIKLWPLLSFRLINNHRCPRLGILLSRRTRSATGRTRSNECDRSTHSVSRNSSKLP